MTKTLTLTQNNKSTKRKKHYIVLDQEPKLYLCADTSWTTNSVFALGINNKEVADLACHKLNESINQPPYCKVVHE